MEAEFLQMIIVNLPNFVGLVAALVMCYKIIFRLLDKLDHCDCDPIDQDGDHAG